MLTKLAFIMKRKINYPINFIIQLTRKRSQTQQVQVRGVYTNMQASVCSCSQSWTPQTIGSTPPPVSTCLWLWGKRPGQHIWWTGRFELFSTVSSRCPLEKMGPCQNSLFGHKICVEAGERSVQEGHDPARRARVIRPFTGVFNSLCIVYPLTFINRFGWYRVEVFWGRQFPVCMKCLPWYNLTRYLGC